MSLIKYLLLLIATIPLYVIGFVKGCMHGENPFKYAGRFVNSYFGF